MEHIPIVHTQGICVEVVRAWPRRHDIVTLTLPRDATVADAIAASGMMLDGIIGYAVHGERVASSDALRDGDRLELLRPLLADPKETRRRRALTQDGFAGDARANKNPATRPGSDGSEQ